VERVPELRRDDLLPAAMDRRSPTHGPSVTDIRHNEANLISPADAGGAAEGRTEPRGPRAVPVRLRRKGADGGLDRVGGTKRLISRTTHAIPQVGAFQSDRSDNTDATVIRIGLPTWNLCLSEMVAIAAKAEPGTRG
jgi:hypothetical protein